MSAGRALVVVALALAIGAGAAHGKGKRGPAPYVDAERGFVVTLPAGWQPVGQDAGEGAAAPLLKVTNDKTGQWLVVLLVKGPTDDAAGDGKAALDNLEAGFATASGYRRLERKRRELPAGEGKKGKVAAADLWFVMTRDGKPVVVGVRALFFKTYTLTLVVDAPGKRIPRETRGIVESFAPGP
jgi:hypothetical protein